MPNELIAQEIIEHRIYIIRGHKVMLSMHLAELYEVETKVLMQAVKRNIERFPDDFMFQLTWKEVDSLRSQIVTLKKGGRGRHRKYLPYAFTEQGVAMLSGVLSSPTAISVHIQIIRTFVNLRRMATSGQELWLRIDEMEKKYDKQFQVVFKAIKLLLDKSKKDFGDKRFGEG